MSRYCSVVVVVVAAAAVLIAAQAADARVVHRRGIASAFVADKGYASGARPTGCHVAPCPSPRPQRKCDNVTYSGSVWVVAELRVQCGVARTLVLKLFRAGLPGWDCHGARGPNVQGHCEESRSRKGKLRAIFWWLDEGGKPRPPRPSVQVIEPPGPVRRIEFVRPWLRFRMTKGRWRSLEALVEEQVCRGWTSVVIGCPYGGLTVDRRGRITVQQVEGGGIGGALARLFGRAARLRLPSVMADAALRLPIRVKTMLAVAGEIVSPGLRLTGLRRLLPHSRRGTRRRVHAHARDPGGDRLHQPSLAMPAGLHAHDSQGTAQGLSLVRGREKWADLPVQE